MGHLDVLDLMPHNWNDHAQWDVYYEAYQRENLHTDTTTIENDLMGTRFIPHLTHNGWQKIWIPGCGMSILSSLLTTLGFKVWASDVSKVAIQGQEDMRRTGFPSLEFINEIKNRFQPEELPAKGENTGELHLIQHDFRTDFVEGDFDCIINVRAFQGLDLDAMVQTAATHWHALAPAKHAIFDTVNVQGEQRDQIENCLVQAGFYIPGYAAEQWYRKALNETGIPHIFVLGQPFPHRGREHYEGEIGQQHYEADRDTLRSFSKEYRQRLSQEATENEHLFMDGVTKIAHVVYSTG